MDNIKPWQIVLFVVAAGVLGFSVWRYVGSNDVNLPDSILVVDVENGDVYRMSLGKRNGAYFPEKNPETGKNTLMPIVQSDEDGKWYISGHARPALQDINGQNNLVNDSNWQVSIESVEVISTLKPGG